MTYQNRAAKNPYEENGEYYSLKGCYSLKGFNITRSYKGSI